MREFSCFLHNALRRIEVSASAPPRLLVSNDRPFDLRILLNPSRKTGWSSALRMRMGLGSGITMPSAIVTLGPRTREIPVVYKLGGSFARLLGSPHQTSKSYAKPKLTTCPFPRTYPDFCRASCS